MATQTPTRDAATVADLVTGTIRTVRGTLSLRQAAEAMAEDGIGLLVVESPVGALAGVVSERDLVGAVAERADLDAERLADLMTDEVLTVRPDDDVGTVAATMGRAEVRHLVVVDGRGRPVGVVSARDLLRTSPEVSSATG